MHVMHMPTLVDALLLGSNDCNSFHLPITVACPLLISVLSIADGSFCIKFSADYPGDDSGRIW